MAKRMTILSQGHGDTLNDHVYRVAKALYVSSTDQEDVNLRAKSAVLFSSDSSVIVNSSTAWHDIFENTDGLLNDPVMQCLFWDTDTSKNVYVARAAVMSSDDEDDLDDWACVLSVCNEGSSVYWLVMFLAKSGEQHKIKVIKR